MSTSTPPMRMDYSTCCFVVNRNSMENKIVLQADPILKNIGYFAGQMCLKV
jgi:hypothetical protein